MSESFTLTGDGGIGAAARISIKITGTYFHLAPLFDLWGRNPGYLVMMSLFRAHQDQLVLEGRTRVLKVQTDAHTLAIIEK